MRTTLLTAGLVLLATSLHASEPTTHDPIVVTGQRAAMPLNRLAEAVIVIDREDIVASAAASVAELLRHRAGVEVLDFFGDGSRVGVGLRGFGENAASNTLILIDGRPQNNPDIGTPDLGRLRLDDIERIEILHGGGALYGDQAVGGVIHIVTRRPDTPSARLDVTGGSFQRQDTQLALAGRLGELDAELSAQRLRSDNYRDHNALDRDGAGLSLGGRWQALDWSLGADYVDEFLETPGALFAEEVAADRRQSAEDFAEDFSAQRTLNWHARGGWHSGPWRAHVEYSQRDIDGRFRLSFRGSQSEPATQDRRVQSVHAGIARELAVAAGTATLQAGLDLRRADYRLNSQFGLQRNDQQIDAAYLGALWPLTPQMDVNVALRHSRAEDAIRDSGDFASLPDGRRIKSDETLGSAGLAWRPAPTWKLFAAWDQVLRFPKVDEYFGSGFTADTIGLVPQTGDSFELGARYAGERLNATLLAFRLQLDEEIVFDPATFTNVNLEDSRRDGVSLDLAWPLGDRITLELAYTYLDAQLRSGELAGKAIPLVARQVGRLGLQLNPGARWQLRLEAAANSDRRLAGDFDNSLAPLPGFAVVNLAATRRGGPWELALRVNNLLDREYAEQGVLASPPPDFEPRAAFFPMPELNATASIAYRFAL